MPPNPAYTAARLFCITSSPTLYLCPLQVLSAESGLDPLPPALSGLSRLRLCHLEHRGRLAEGAACAPLLPGGPWLRSLQWLSVGPGTLLSSTAVLQGVTALECVTVAYSPTAKIDWGSSAVAAFFDWLARHPPLRRLSFDAARLSAQPMLGSIDFVVHMTHLGRQRPVLLVQYPGWRRGEGETFFGHLYKSHPF